MDDLYQQIVDGRFQVFSSQGGLPYGQREQWPPVRYLNFVGEAKVAPEGVIDLPYMQERIRNLLPYWTSNMVVVNVEGELCRGRSAWSSSPEEWRETAEDIKRIIAAIKEVDGTLKCSFVLYLPSRFYAGFRHGRCVDYAKGMEWIKWMAFLLAPHLDFYTLGRCPAPAVTDDARDHWEGTDRDRAEWLIHAQATQDSLTEVRRSWPKKPLIPVIFPQWTNAQSKPHYHDQWSFVSPAWVRDEMNQIRGLADSVCVWVQANSLWTDLTPQQAADKFWASEQGHIVWWAAR